MDRRTIVFTAPGIAQLQTERIPSLDAHSVLLKTAKSDLRRKDMPEIID